MSNRSFRVALVGCGQIADAHLQQIKRIPRAETVAVCDLEPLLARQAAERFHVPAQFTEQSAAAATSVSVSMDVKVHCVPNREQPWRRTDDGRPAPQGGRRRLVVVVGPARRRPGGRAGDRSLEKE